MPPEASPRGPSFLAFYDAEDQVHEALLLRVLAPTKLPTDSDVIASMVEYYKDNLKTSGQDSHLDSYTRYEFSFSGLECRVLGTFYDAAGGRVEFGADVENFYSAHNYSVVKPHPPVLEMIVNFREGDISGTPSDIRIGRVRYSSTRRFPEADANVPVYVTPRDVLGTRTALFGMTRTGKSNTVKKVIQATVSMSEQAPTQLPTGIERSTEDEEGHPWTSLTRSPRSGSPSIQSVKSSSISTVSMRIPTFRTKALRSSSIYEEQTTRYSVIKKPAFKVMKVNFFRDVESGFDLIRSFLEDESSDYVRSFLAVDMTQPDDYTSNRSAKTRYDRKVAAYLCCLYRAGFPAPTDFRVTFEGNADLNHLVREDGSLDPKESIALTDAADWWTAIWENYHDQYFADYKKKKGHEWADDDLKAILGMLTRRKQPGGTGAVVSGYLKLRPIKEQHTDTVGKSFELEIVEELRAGRIVIVDLSQGDPKLQQLFSERICRHIFNDAMARFVATLPNNFIQFYFEEAHNLFPKKDDKDLSQIYNRLAKEGAKLNLGLVYATQEVSSISANILKNTQNWFIAHLNNEDEDERAEEVL